MPAEKLGRGVHHQIGSEAERALERGRGHGVVAHARGPSLVRDAGQPRDVRHLPLGIGGGLHPNEARAGTPRRLRLPGIGHVNQGVLQSPGTELLTQEALGAVVGVGRRDHMITRGEGHEDGGGRRRARGEGNRGFAAIELAQTLLQHRSCGIAVARIEMPAWIAAVCIALEGRGGVDGRRHRSCGRIDTSSGVDGQRFQASRLRSCISPFIVRRGPPPPRITLSRANVTSACVLSPSSPLPSRP